MNRQIEELGECEMNLVSLFIPHSNLDRKDKMQKSFTVGVTTMCLMFTWVIWVSNYGGNHRVGRSAMLARKSGEIHDIEQDLHGFSLKGFVYYKNSPVRRRTTLKATSIWLLNAKTKYGTIAFKDIQMKHVKPRDVTVVIKYHINWEGTAKLSVNGLDLKNHELVTVQMSQYGDSYCTKVLFLGPVHQVAIVASALEKNAFVIIDELKIGVGTADFDSLEEEHCK